MFKTGEEFNDFITKLALGDKYLYIKYLANGTESVAYLWNFEGWYMESAPSVIGNTVEVFQCAPFIDYKAIKEIEIITEEECFYFLNPYGEYIPESVHSFADEKLREFDRAYLSDLDDREEYYGYKIGVTRHEITPEGIDILATKLINGTESASILFNLGPNDKLQGIGEDANTLHDFLLAQKRKFQESNPNIKDFFYPIVIKDDEHDTSGYTPFKILEKVMDKVDLFLYDLKIMDEEKHKQATGVPNDLILENLKRLSDKGAIIHIRIPLIPGLSDTNKNLSQTVEFLSILHGTNEISLLPYHRIGNQKYQRLNVPRDSHSFPAPSKEMIKKTEKRFKNAGFSVKIGG